MACRRPTQKVHFLGIGAQKAGTTWLYEWLGRHPEIAFPAGKELQFWNHREGRAPEVWLAAFPEARPGVLQGEITPAYALLGDEAVATLQSLCPDLRIFFSMRNPMERAWSAALMALERAELELDEASDAWFADHFRSRGSLGRGDYETALRRWRDRFGEHAVLALLHDEIRSRPGDVLARLARHIGVRDDRYFDRFPADRLAEPVFAGQGAPVRPSLRPLLRELYAPRIESLGRYLDRDLSSWLRFADGAGA